MMFQKRRGLKIVKGGLVCLKVLNCYNKKDCVYYVKINNFIYEDFGLLLII